MAMLPFCGYNIADYFSHWLQMGRSLMKRGYLPRQLVPARRRGRFLWPGFGRTCASCSG
jgi:phosphoenolpyruvate carboxykinase (GTP)